MRNTNEPLVDIRPGRRVGNTIRQVDKAIDWLFQGETVEIEDHYNYDKSFQQHLREANTRLLHLILDRLRNEHHIKSDIIIIHEPKLAIKLTV